MANIIDLTLISHHIWMCIYCLHQNMSLKVDLDGTVADQVMQG